MVRTTESATVKDESSDSDSPLSVVLQRRKKGLLALKRDHLDESIARLENIQRPRSHGRRFFVDGRTGISTTSDGVPPPSTRGRKKPGRPPRAKRPPEATDNVPHWYPVNPPTVKGKRRADNHSVDMSVASFTDTGCTPRIWASNLQELLEILPGTLKPVNGISWQNSNIPFLLLEGPTCPDDCWSSALSIELSLIRGFSCAKADFESPNIKIESHIFEATEPPLKIYDKNGHLIRPALVNRTDSTTAFDLSTDCPFIDSAGYYEDLSVMLLPIPLPAPSSSPPATVAPIPQCTYSCTRMSSSWGCKVCGNDIDLPTPSTATAQSMKPQSPITDWPSSDNMDLVDQHTDMHSDGEDDDGLTLVYPDDHDELSSLLAPYQRRMRYRMSSLRSTLPQTENYAINLPQPIIFNNTKQPNIFHKSYSGRSDAFDRRIPKIIPAEIQALIDARTDGIPIAVIVSRDSTLSPVLLPPEYGCSYLGLFFLADIHAERIKSHSPNEPTSGRISGRVQWKLRLHWTPGGEDLLPDGQNLTKPWWAPTPPANGDISAMQDVKYMARQDLQNHCHNLLPLGVHAELGPHTSSGPFPKGWYCTDCGKLNKQIFLRHRRCSSSSCQSNAGNAQSAAGYAVRLAFAREHPQALPLVAPANLVPKTVLTTVSAWADGMHTYCYALNDKVAAKHVFTSNRDNLQKEANFLFRAIQEHVELRREIKGPGYFTYLVGKGCGSDSCATGWQDAPSCLHQGRDLMVHQGRTYGETENCAVNMLTLMAWVTPGRGKGPMFGARQGVVTILCLGADAVLSLVPKSGFRAPEIGDPLPDVSSETEMTLIDPSFNPGKTEPSEESMPRSTNKETAKKKVDAAVMTLVHGDVLVLTADDFEAHIKRTGTTIRRYFIGFSYDDTIEFPSLLVLIGTTVSDNV